MSKAADDEWVSTKFLVLSVEVDRLRAENERLREALDLATKRLDWSAGLIPIDQCRDQAAGWADEARAALAAARKEGE